MKRHTPLLLCIIALLFILIACAPSLTVPTKSNLSASSASSSSSSPETVTPAAGSQVSSAVDVSPADMSRFVAYLKTPEKIRSYVGYTSHKFFGGNVFAVADATQFKKISTLLAPLASLNFETCGPNTGAAAGCRFLIENGDGSCDLTIISNNGVVTFAVSFNGGVTFSYFRNISGTVPFIELAEACSSVLSDTSDAENCGVGLALDGSGETHTLIKADTAKLQNILDGTAEYYGHYMGKEKYVFDGQVTIGKTVYKLDSQTGIFSRTQDGKAEIYKLEDYVVFCTMMMTQIRPS